MNERYRPMIGMTPFYSIEGDRKRITVNAEYMDYLTAAGAYPVLLPFDTDEASLEAALARCDGFLFTGGADVDPTLYGEENRACESMEPERDALEEALLRRILTTDKPVLGICRGMQLINAVLGGTLWQDLPAEVGNSVSHRADTEGDTHTVTVLPDTPLADCIGAGERGVNSHHHQAVRTLAPALRPMATAPDGITEAAWLPDKPFFWVVQWHPERRNDCESSAVARAFVKAAGAK